MAQHGRYCSILRTASLPEPAIAFLACPADFYNPAPALDWLAQISSIKGHRESSLFLAVGTKFTPPSGVRTFNIEAHYPAELAQLATHFAWSSIGETGRLMHRDARALFCLRNFAQAHSDTRHIVLILDGLRKSDMLIDSLEARPAAAPLCCIGQTDQGQSAEGAPALIFDRNHPDAEAALTVALDIALTGAIYGIQPYSLDALLEQMTQGLSISVDFLP